MKMTILKYTETTICLLPSNRTMDLRERTSTTILLLFHEYLLVQVCAYETAS
jgi:hypothetical protein